MSLISDCFLYHVYYMVSLKLPFTCILATLLIATSVHASFAVCVGIKDAGPKRIMGFHLWNDDGKQSQNYRTTYEKTIQLENQGWMITPEEDIVLGGPRAVWYENTQYKVNYAFPKRAPLCEYRHEGRFRGIYFWCYENGQDEWCNRYQDSMRWMCADYLHMGQDSVACNLANRPTP
ncbi:hypothetical protein BG000_011789 [Podila horticola]|nr:hypothetical protein BG000_011789 [Podila horticola]